MQLGKHPQLPGCRPKLNSSDAAALRGCTVPVAPKQLRRSHARHSKAANTTAASSSSSGLTEADLQHLRRASKVADNSAGLTQPHPNSGCVLVDPSGRVVSEAYQRAQGTEPSESQAAKAASGAAAGGTAYVNLETGDCHGEAAAVRSLLGAGVARVVVGLRHPLPHLRGAAIAELRGAGVEVQVLGEAPCAADVADERDAYLACLAVNEGLLHRALTRRPMGILKYAMTLDGKIATQSGHSAWVSCPDSRAIVFETRSRCDAVLVGGQTVRRDNPQLTTRREGGHAPARIVLSRTLDLPEDAKLWDVSAAPTIVMTQRGARSVFQSRLRDRGVEVVEFDFLTPGAVADYCYERGFLQTLWECGGTLAAPAISGGAIHKVMAFIAPKIVGGPRAPTPVGELGFVEMTQALNLCDAQWRQVGPDLLMTGYLPTTSGGLELLDERAAGLLLPPGAGAAPASSSPTSASATPAAAVSPLSGTTEPRPGRKTAALAAAAAAAGAGGSGQGSGEERRTVEFYKAWDEWGALSNFSPHAIRMPESPIRPAATTTASSSSAATAGPSAQPSSSNGAAAASSSSSQSSNGAGPHAQPAAAAAAAGSKQVAMGGQEAAVSGPATAAEPLREFPSVEHFYQSQKLAGVPGQEAAELYEAIVTAPSPEEAARVGRRTERASPHLVRPDWQASKVEVMRAAVAAKFASHEGPRAMLLASGRGDHEGSSLLEASPHDRFWGRGYDGSGLNMLGELLTALRADLEAAEASTPATRQQQREGQAGQGHAAPAHRDQRQGHQQQGQQPLLRA